MLPFEGMRPCAIASCVFIGLLLGIPESAVADQSNAHYRRGLALKSQGKVDAAIEAFQGVTAAALGGLPTRDLLARLVTSSSAEPGLQTERRSQQVTRGRLKERIKSRRHP